MFCTGNGKCLSTKNDLNKNILLQKINRCKHKCKPVICLNYLNCGTSFPRWKAIGTEKFCENCYYNYDYGLYKDLDNYSYGFY